MLLVVNRYDVAHKGVLIRAEIPCPEKIYEMEYFLSGITTVFQF
jgi:hypothetical protein